MMPNNSDIIHQNVFIKRGIYSTNAGPVINCSFSEDNFSKALIDHKAMENDRKRRMMHKEIERRRRDKINDWIMFLSKQVPDCASDRTKQVLVDFT